MSRKLFAEILLITACACAPLAAQEARGGLTGRIADPQGGVIPGAKIVITNLATNEVRRTTTNDTGYYEVNFLEPSTYSISVEAGGFKKALRSGIEVSVGTKLDIGFTMEVGAVVETVEVTAEAPMLETTSASGGRVLDQKQLVNLPFSDLNPFALSALAPGMQWTGQPEYRRPFDNGGTSAFNTAGGVGNNEYTMDGMTVTGTGRRVGFTPPADSVTEFKLETSNFDASQGFSSGAAVNVLSKSGTNALHGSVFDQMWQQRWNATPHFTRLQWQDQVNSGKISPSTQKQASGRSNNYGISASGPIWIPKLYNGKNKFFWTITWNGIKQSKAETTDSVNNTVPTQAMKAGDFSELWNAPNGVNLYTVYDPRSARKEGSNVVRTPFPGNKGVPILNPMYANYVKFYPDPNNVPGLVTPEGFNNYLASAMPKNENFNAIVNRYDYVINEKNHVNFRWQWNDRLANEYDWTYQTVPGLQSNGLTRINQGGNVNYLWTINATNILDVNAGVARFKEGNRRTVPLQYTPSGVGLPAYMDARAGDLHLLPRIDMNNINDVSDSYPAIGNIATTYEFRASMTTIKGSHTFKYGWQQRRMDFAQSGPGYTSGYFTFRNNYTRKSDTDNVSSNHGLDWASFMMGVPQSLYLDTNDSFYFQMPRTGLYFQDDWRLTNKIRLSLGLRYEYEGGESERFDRGISWAFINDAKLPITDAVQAAYAANPMPELPASQFKVLGGSSYLGQNGLGTATKGTNILLPKFGIVYQINDKTVIRAGWGMYMDSLNVNNDRPYTDGYTQPTNTPISNDSGFSFCCGVGDAGNIASGKNVITDPFPVRANGTRFDDELKNALGYMARTGKGFNALVWDYRPPLQQRWRIGIQREIVRNLLLDVSYNGAYAFLPVRNRVDYLDQKYWASGSTRNQAVDDYLNANVSNPYNIKNLTGLQTTDPVLYNYLAGQSFFSSSNIRRNTLLRPMSQTNNLQGIRPGVDWHNIQGYNKYSDFQIMLEKRFGQGLTTSFMYTHASGYVADYFYNEFDATPSERLNNNLVPNRIAFTGTYDMPWGKNRRWIKDGFLSNVIGNWNLGWVYQFQSGPATDWGNPTTLAGNRFFYGNMDNLSTLFNHDQVHSQDIHVWFDPNLAWRGPGNPTPDCQCFEGRSSAQPGTYQVRMFPYRIDSIRADGIRNWDLKVERTFPIRETMKVRFSLDLLNLTNHTNFSAPQVDPTNSQFGRVTSQRGLSRVIQFNLRFEF